MVYNNNNKELGLSMVLSPRCAAPGVHAQSGFSAFGCSHVLNWRELCIQAMVHFSKLQGMLCKAKTAVCPSESKTIRQSHPERTFLRLVRSIVAIKPISQAVQIDSWWHHIL